MKKSIILFTIATAGILSSCGGGGGNNNSESLSVIPPTPPTPQPVATARTLSCSECSQQEINTLKAAGASINAQAGESIVVQMTLTQAEYGRLVTLLNEIRNSKTTTPSPTPPVQPVRTGCYLEYEYGRYEYECDDDDYRATVTTSLSNSQNPRCYYEYENGRQEYECEDERYEIVVPQRPTTDGNPTPPLRDGQNPVGCYWDDDEYECYYANGWECEYEHGRWECEYEGRSGLGTRSYYQLPDEGDDAFRGGLSQNIRGYLQNGADLGDFRFAADSELHDMHLEYRASPLQGERVGLFADFGFRRENSGETAAHYGKMTGLYSAPFGADLYASFSAGRVDSEVHENTALRGYSFGVFLRDIPRENISAHFRMRSVLSADEVAENKFAADIRIGEENAQWQIGGFYTPNANKAEVRINAVNRF